MSKLSFRARQLDASKSMPVYLVDEIPDMPDFTAINRAVPQMPTGMEKEEETEHHLQRALSAQQVYGTSEALVIPVPEIEGTACGCPVYAGKWKDYRPPKQYIHVQPFGLDQEIPDYDMDSEDETWLNKQAKNLKMDVSSLKFENMMDRLEKGSGQTVVSLQDAKALIKEDDDLIIAVYDYWLNKRLRLQHALIPSVKTEKRDGSTTNNPYVAFRRRTEKMQTRKNRKNDEASYEKMLKLRRDLNRALTILEMIKRREKSKKELLQLTIEVVEKRYEMQDWEGKSLAEALAQRHKVQPFVPMPSQYIPREWGHKPKLFGSTQDDSGFVRKKREYKKRKHKQAASSSLLSSHLPQYGDVEAQQATNAEAFSSEDDALSPLLSASDHELDDDPDGIYAFRRKEGCLYHAPILDGQGSWPWCSREEGGLADPRYRYSHTMLSRPRRRYIGPARRRVGRGGRVLFDRLSSSWEDENSDSDVEMTPQQNNLNYFRPCSPLVDDVTMATPFTAPLSPPRLHPSQSSSDFNTESFLSHQQQLLQMQRQQQEEILKRETDQPPANIDPVDLDSTLTSTATSRFTLDSASAQFAASAVCSSSKDYVGVSRDSPLLVLPSALSSLLVDSLNDTVTSQSPQVNLAVNSELLETLNNGPIPDNKSCGLSTSPAANVLQLNFPLTPSSLDTPTTPVVTSSITNCSLQSISSLAKSPNNAGLLTKVVSSSTPPTILKIGTSLVNKNNTLAVNHEPVNNIVQEQGVPMEVT